MFDLDKIIRKNIRELAPYSSARDEFSGSGNVWLDANENPVESGLNRYPDPRQKELKKAVAKLKNINPENVFLGNGSDEAIDLLYRCFCEPGKDSVILMPPTYGMYSVCANINNIKIVEVPLTKTFQIDLEKVTEKIQQYEPKLTFICSPNNPTGNLMHRKSILEIARVSTGLVVVDEAYIDFAETKSISNELDNYPNIVVLQTFSKAWGLAGIRLGLAFAQPAIIELLNKVKYPYNISTLTQDAAIKVILNKANENKTTSSIISERKKLESQLKSLKDVTKVFPSDANFLLVEFRNAFNVYKQLSAKGIVVRDRTKYVQNCLRISVGTKQENQLFINELTQIVK